jgi:hypothetical protein
MELPYHCPRLRCDYLRSPCAKMIEAAAEKWAVFPRAMLEFKDHCLECRGQELVRREGAKGAGVQSAQEDTDMRGVVAFKDEAEARRVLGPDKIPAVSEAPCCPRHPNELQVACSETGKRAGQFMGACKVCMAERRVGRKPKGTEKMTPAVLLDLKKKKGEVSVAESNAAIVPPVMENPALLPVAPPASGNSPLCTRHNRPIRFNRLGVSMGGCEECRREIAAIGGAKTKIQLAQNPIERIFAAYPDKLAWLLETAGSQVRTPEGQLIYLVRQAWEQGR